MKKSQKAPKKTKSAAEKKSEAELSDRPDLPEEFLIVGLGASAGGIQALKDFFVNVPADSGMAYVVILHLSPDHDSQLANVLQTVAQIPVTQVTKRTKVEPNHVYVVPPNEHLEMANQHIVVTPNLNIEDRRAPVDIFFRTLAESHQARAVAVILSGTGANGSMGIKRIKERGGAAFVQNPREAEFSEMPRNSIATDLIDQILNVAEIPARLIAYKKSLGKIEIPVEAEQRPEDTQQALREIFTHLRLRIGHDFSNYKRPTILRRIERRINVFDLPNITAYARFMGENRQEATALLKDLLISVTNFFRDKDAFLYLEQNIVPRIFNGKHSEDQVRLWIAGCATGEEAYSLAMLCAERTLGSLDAPTVQIFATDIDDQAIATAREGVYTLNDAADVSPERLRRFFTKEGNSYRIRREIREMILFANHNVIKDPPFSKLDMVTCRNMLIYLNPTAQERVMEVFHFALNPGGFLFVGNSESVDGASDLYAPVSKENHVYQTRQIANRIAYPVPESYRKFANMNFPAMRDSVSSTAISAHGESIGDNERAQTQALERISFGDLHQQLLELYAPPSILINEEYDILHLSERAGRFLQIAGGEPSKNLLKLIRPELRLELRAALYQAVQRQTNVEVKNLKIRVDERDETLSIYARPVLTGGDLPATEELPVSGDDKQKLVAAAKISPSLARGFILVIFESSETPEVVVDTNEAIQTTQAPIARQLEEELLRTKSQLRNTIEQFELQTEELRASNEELQAMNEELRSAAEELETSKEELQSVNEELITVNQELKVKIEELSQSNNDFQNLIYSTDIATIFLDRSFRVNTFTPAASRIFNLIPADFGRPLTDITHRLESHNLLGDAETVLETLQTVEREIRTTDGRTHLLRVLPYRTAEDRINGVVATFLDITEQKHAEESVRQSAARQTYLLRIADAIRSLSDAVEITEKVTQTAMNYLKTDRCYYGEIDGDVVTIRRDAQGKDFPSIAKNYLMSEMPLFKAAVESGQPIVVRDIDSSDVVDETIREFCHSVGILSFINVPVIKNNQPVGFFCLTQSRTRDWTDVEIELAQETAERMWSAVERARVEEALRESEMNLSALFSAMPVGVALINTEGKVIFSNSEMMRFLPSRLMPSIDKERSWRWKGFYQNGEPLELENYPGKRALRGETAEPIEFLYTADDGEEIWTRVVILPVREAGGDVSRFVCVITDIDELKRNAGVLRQSEEKYRSMFNSIDEGFALIEMIFDETGADAKATDYRFLDVNPVFERQTGLRDVVGKTVLEILPDIDRAIIERYGRVAQTGESLRFDSCVAAMDNATFSVFATRVGGADSRQVAVVFDDITERIRFEERREFLLKFSDAIRSLDHPLEIQTVGMRMLGEHLNATRAYLFFTEPAAGGDWIHIIETDYLRDADMQSNAGRHSVKNFGIELFDGAERGEVIAIEDITKVKQLTKAQIKKYLAIDVRAFVNVPLVRDGKFVAGIGAHDSVPRSWKPEEIALIKEVAERMWSAITRARAEEALRESEERLTLAASVSGFGIHDFDVVNNRLYWSPELKAMHGLAPDAEIDFEHFGEYVHPNDRERVERAARAALDPKGTGEFEQEFRIVRPDNGETRYLYNRSRTVFEGKGKKRRALRNTGIVVDVTRSKHLEEAVRQSEEQLRIAVESAEMGTWTWDVPTDAVFWNERHFTLFGMQPTGEPQSSAAFFDRVHPQDRQWVGERLQKAVEEKGVFEAEFRIVREDTGETCWMEGYGRVVFYDATDGAARRMSGVMSDITERREFQEALRGSEERLRLLIESASDYAIFTITLDNRIDSWNAGAEKIFGWTETEVLGKSGEIIFTPEDREKNAPEQELKIALRDGRAPDERFHLRKDGSRFYASGVTTVMRYENGEIQGFVKIARDMTEQINAEKALRDKELLQKLVVAQEDERKRIARDLHDELGQQLIALRLKLELAKQSCNEEELCAKIVEMEQIARSIDYGVDFLAWELRPAALDHLGLFAALENYINQWSRHSGVAAELLASKLKRTRFAPAVETNLYRIVQEALNNTHKHARAKNVVVILEKRDDLVVLVIEDDGTGFNPNSKKNTSKGLGLIGMKERAHLIGGEIEIESAPGKGTTVFVRIPASIVKRKRTDEK